MDYFNEVKKMLNAQHYQEIEFTNEESIQNAKQELFDSFATFYRKSNNIILVVELVNRNFADGSEIEQFKQNQMQFEISIEEQLYPNGISRIDFLTIYFDDACDLAYLLQENKFETSLQRKSFKHEWVVDFSEKKTIVLNKSSSNIYGLKTNINKILKTDGQIDFTVPVRSKSIFFTYALIAVNALIFLITIFDKNTIFLKYANISRSVFSDHQYYRLLTSVFLHADISHIGYNMFSLYIFGNACEKYFGKIPFLFIYFVSGIVGSFASAITNVYSLSIGASGAIMGVMGAVLVLTRYKRNSLNGLDYPTIFIMAFLNIAQGFIVSGIDNAAHIGGFVSGILMAVLFIFLLGKQDLKANEEQSFVESV